MNGALNVNGTVTATNFSGSGTGLTGIGTSNLAAITGTPSNLSARRRYVGNDWRHAFRRRSELYSLVDKRHRHRHFQHLSERQQYRHWHGGRYVPGCQWLDPHKCESVHQYSPNSQHNREHDFHGQRPECRNHYFFRSQLCWHRDDNTFNRAASRR
jgi:hypothetical protein